MIFPTWGEGSPVAVIIDPFTAKKSGKIEILVSLWATWACYAKKFSASARTAPFNKSQIPKEKNQ